MVRVLADVVEVVVLASSADAFLRVDCSFVLAFCRGWIDGAEEDGLELVHAGIGEEESWVGEGDNRG